MIVKRLEDSRIATTQLMPPSRFTFSRKIHGGDILNLMEQIPPARACRHAGFYCITGSGR